MNRFILFVCSCLFFCGVQAQEPLQAELQIFRVQPGPMADTLGEVREVQPGMVLEYVLSYRNVSRQNLAGFEVRTPIPLNTWFVLNSERSFPPAVMDVSLDGGESWTESPPTRLELDETGTPVLRTVPPQQYTDLRWQIDDLLPPGGAAEIRFRVVVQP